MIVTMTDKELVLQQLGRLDENASVEELAEELQIFAAIRAAERAGAEGRVVPHDAAKKLVNQWISK